MKKPLKIIGKSLGITFLIAICISIVILLIRPKQTEFGACYKTCQTDLQLSNDACFRSCAPSGK